MPGKLKLKNGDMPALGILFTSNCHIYQNSGFMIYDDKTFVESNQVYTDPYFLAMFSIEAIHGDINTMLDDPMRSL